MSNSETQVLYIVKPPYTEQDRKRLFDWLNNNVSLEADECRQIALTGELTPFLLTVSKTNDKPADWAAQLEAMDVPVLFDSIPVTERPLEAVYVNGKFADTARAIEFRNWWNSRYPDSPIQSSKLSKLRHGADVMCLGTIEVRDTDRDREPLNHMLERAGLNVLAWIDIRDPWVD